MGAAFCSVTTALGVSPISSKWRRTEPSPCTASTTPACPRASSLSSMYSPISARRFPCGARACFSSAFHDKPPREPGSRRVTFSRNRRKRVGRRAPGIDRVGGTEETGTQRKERRRGAAEMLTAHAEMEGYPAARGAFWGDSSSPDDRRGPGPLPEQPEGSSRWRSAQVTVPGTCSSSRPAGSASR